MEEKKEVMILNQFGICPRCGKLMGMLEATYTMYGITPNGRYPNRLIHEEKDVTYACLCGAKYQMVRTVAGIYPKDYYKLDEIQNKTINRNLSNLIGRVVGGNEEDGSISVSSDNSGPGLSTEVVSDEKR